MQKNKRTSRFVSLALSLAMTLTQLPAQAGAVGQQPPEPSATVSADFFSQALSLEFGYQRSGWIEHITGLLVDGVPYEQVDSTFKLGSGTYMLLPSNGRITLPPTLSGTVGCTIQADGYEDLHLTLDTGNRTVSVTDEPRPFVGKPETGAVTATLEEIKPFYLKLTINGVQDYVKDITAIQAVSADGDTTDLKPVSGRIYLNGPAYFLDEAESAVYFDDMNPAIKDGDTLHITSGQPKDLQLKVTRTDSGYQVQVLGEEQPQPDADERTLHVRLVGFFEPALVDQKGYDAITGATSTVTVNKNSSVEVQCALVNKDEVPADSDWFPLHESGVTVRRDKSTVEISPQGSGMKGVYSTLDSALTLSGTPAQKGEYQVSVTVTDDQGRKAVSNALPFLVYGGDEKLADQLTMDHVKQAQDGKYLYDMVPWSIRTFGGTNETVTVPAQIKAWFGSHTSGTYGKLGYNVANDQEPVQTLLIPTGCDLTLANMDLLSSVKVVVQSGGKLTLQDSVVQGVIEVENGGTFSMNYDSYHGTFLTGASINGQLRLKSGAVLENAAIYSNTNFIANGNEARKNSQSVVAVLGDVTVKGQVFLRGDEAPTGTDPLTEKSYAGQAGLSVTGGTLTLTDGALLAVYGGGTQASTSVGGTAILLENGTITGSGTLLAVGGDGTFDRGGDAVSGTGTITTAKAYLQGGTSGYPKSDDITGGKAAAAGVNAPNAVKNDGVICRSEGERPHIPRWTGASSAPSLAEVEQLVSYMGVSDHTPAVFSVPAPPASGGSQSPSQPDKRTAPTRYNVRVDKTDANGSLTVSANQAEKGKTLRITVQPKENYLLEKLTVTDRSGKEVPLSKQGEGQYHFAMPASQVSIQARFAPASKPAVAPPAVTFQDVSSTDYCYPAVQWAVGKNVAQGTSANTFSPDAPCTRAQAVTFLWRAAGSPAPKGTAAPFRDVEPGAYYSDAVRWAVEQGITGGTGDGAFSPDLAVTRAQAVALLHRAAGSPAARTSSAFSDVAGGSYYAAAAQWAGAQGIAQGTGGNRFSPDQDCTRGQIVSLLYRGVQQAAFSW